MKSLAQVLSIKLIESLREEKGGVYSGRVSARVTKYPAERYLMAVMFPCAPDNTQMLISTFHKLIQPSKSNMALLE